MKQEFYDAVISNPIISAVKEESELEHCLQIADTNIVFILYGQISTIASIVEKVKASGKIAVVHMDLIAGLSSRVESVDFIAQYTKADGIISTRFEQIKHAKELNLSTIYRIFAIDSKSLNNIPSHISYYADMIEILPGLMPKIIQHMVKKMSVPIIAGGLIADKEDVIAALDAGAIAISSTNENVWSM